MSRGNTKYTKKPSHILEKLSNYNEKVRFDGVLHCRKCDYFYADKHNFNVFLKHNKHDVAAPRKEIQIRNNKIYYPSFWNGAPDSVLSRYGYSADGTLQQKSRRKVISYIVGSKRITPDDYTENKLRYDQEISRVKQQIERLEEADKSFYVTASYLLQLFKHGEKIFELASIEEKRELLKLVLSNLELKDKTVRFTPNEPFATVLKLSERSTWQGYMDEDRTFYSVSENAILGGKNV